MRYVKKSKVHLVMLICCFMVLFAGCINKITITEVDNTSTSGPVEAGEQADNTSTSGPVDSTGQADNAPTAEPVETTAEQIDTDDEFKEFRELKECFIDYDFKVEINGTENEPVSFVNEGRYDLNNDGTQDEISILLKGSYSDKDIDCYVKVNNAKSNLWIDYTENGEVKLIDIDKNDNYIEIACFDEGPSADPQYHIFRYDGDKLFSLGSLDAWCEINEYGKIVSNFFKARLSPSFYSAWYEVDNNEFIIKNNDINKYLGKSYTLNGEAFFSPSETITYEVDWSNSKTFNNETVKLIDIGITEENRILNNYFIEFDNGEKGMLNFWIGD